MATFKAVVFAHHKKKDGTYNVKIRVTHKGGVKYINTPIFVSQSQMTRGLKIKDAAVLDAIDNYLLKVRGKVNALPVEVMDIEMIVARLSSEHSESSFSLPFIEYGRKVKAGQQAYTAVFGSLTRYLKGGDIDINSMSAKWLKGYAEWLKPQVKERTYINYLSFIKVVHRQAVKEFNDIEMGVLLIRSNPFARFTIPRMPLQEGRALTREAIQKIIDYSPITNHPTFKGHSFEELAKDLFLLSLGTIGMNLADVVECCTWQQEQITYYRKKTRNKRVDKAKMMLHITPQVRAILNKYSPDYFYQWNTRHLTTAINKGLKNIAQAIGVEAFTYYAARHSWATLAYNECGINKYVVHEAINHASGAMAITDIYIKKDYSIYWAANEKVLALFDWSNL